MGGRSLAEIIAGVVEGRKHRAVVFRSPNDVPPGSNGYFSPSGRSAHRLTTDGSWSVKPMEREMFTSQSGPGNDHVLAEELTKAIAGAFTLEPKK